MKGPSVHNVRNLSAWDENGYVFCTDIPEQAT